MAKRWMILGGVILAALLVTVVVLLIVVIGQNNAAAEQAELERINMICEDGLADPYGDDLHAFAECQSDLLSR